MGGEHTFMVYPFVLFDLFPFFVKFLQTFFQTLTKLDQEADKMCLWCFPLNVVLWLLNLLPHGVHEPTLRTPGSPTSIQHFKLLCYHQLLQTSCFISWPFPASDVSQSINKPIHTEASEGRKWSAVPRFHMVISSRISWKPGP